MDFLFKLADLFTNTAKNIATYLPQSGADLVQIFGKIGDMALGMNVWITSHLGVNIQAIIAFIGGLFLNLLHYTLNFIKAVAERL